MNTWRRWKQALSGAAALPAARVAATLAAAMALTGCWEESGSAGKIVIRSAGSFADEPGAVVGPLLVQVLSAPIRGSPGRNGFREPVAEKEVRFRLRDADPEAEMERLPSIVPGPEAPPDGTPSRELVIRSNLEGYAQVYVRLPRAVGDWRVRAEVQDQFLDEKDVNFVIVSGLKVVKSGVENSVGRKVPIAVQVFELGPDGSVGPAEKVSVQFQIPAGGQGHLKGENLTERIETNARGIADANLTLGEESGVQHVLVQVRDRRSATGAKEIAVVLHGVAIDWTRAGADIASGSLLILLALRILSSGLLNLLGPALVLPVTSFSRSRSRAIFGGFIAGAMFQSSISVTSRLISMANGGLLAAAAAAPVILGANIGRTLLPQILAFPVEMVGVPLIALGVLGLFLPRRLELHSWSWVVLGTGLILLGDQIIDDGARILDHSALLRTYLAGWDFSSEHLSFWGRFSILALSSGMVAVTCFVLRSSNMPVLLTVILGDQGVLPPALALPVILGANLGPTLALLAASLGRRLEARRVSIHQFLAQLLGALWFAPLCLVTFRGSPLALYLTDACVPGILCHPPSESSLFRFPPENVGHHLAMVHTLYNVITSAVALLLSGLLRRLSEQIVPRDPVRDDVKPYNLDQNLLVVPPLAILQATHEVTYLTELVRKMLAESYDSFRYRDLKLSEQTVRRVESIERIHREVSQYLLRVNESDLPLRLSSRLEVLQSTAAGLSRIGELGEALRDLTTRELDEGAALPEDVSRDLNDAYDLVMSQFDNILRLLQIPDGRTEENALKVAERLAKFGSRAEHLWFERLKVHRSGGPAIPSAPASAAGAAPLAAPLQERPAAAPAEIPGPPESATPEMTEPRAGGDASSTSVAHLLIFRHALEILFQIAGHLSHIAERMRVLSSR